MFHILLITSDLIKSLTATLRENEKVRNDLYIIGINFTKLHIQGFEKVLLRVLRKKIFHVSKRIKRLF